MKTDRRGCFEAFLYVRTCPCTFLSTYARAPPCFPPLPLLRCWWLVPVARPSALMHLLMHPAPTDGLWPWANTCISPHHFRVWLKVNACPSCPSCHFCRPPCQAGRACVSVASCCCFWGFLAHCEPSFPHAVFGFAFNFRISGVQKAWSGEAAIPFQRAATCGQLPSTGPPSRLEHHLRTSPWCVSPHQPVFFF